jgi:hypothetical protein
MKIKLTHKESNHIFTAPEELTPTRELSVTINDGVSPRGRFVVDCLAPMSVGEAEALYSTLGRALKYYRWKHRTLAN